MCFKENYVEENYLAYPRTEQVMGATPIYQTHCMLCMS